MTTMRTAVLRCLVILAAFGASAANADLENENLLITAPPGYKVGFNDKKPNMVMTEFVPAKETVENWTEMVTVQVFFGLKTRRSGSWRFGQALAGGLSGIRKRSHRRGRSRERLPDARVAVRLPEKSAERQAGNHLVQGCAGQ